MADTAETGAAQAMIAEMAQDARASAAILAQVSGAQRAEALRHAAASMRAQADEILRANAQDLERGRESGLSPAMMDRLMLDPARVEAMACGINSVAAQQDSVGRVLEAWDRPNGLHIQRVATPIGVLGVIYESRPNVTADAGALALKSGNAVILRGGSDSLHSSAAIHRCMVAGLAQAGLPPAAIQLVQSPDRALVGAMLTAVGLIDVIIPRGGKGLVGRVQAEARVPVFAHLEGINHVYIDAAADPDMAINVLKNAKLRRTGICGAAEAVLIHRDFPATERLLHEMIAAGAEIRAEGALAGISGTVAAQPDDFGREFLDAILAARQVDSLDDALAHIRRYGSGHTDAIVTADAEAAQAFFDGLDSAILMHNASTQFADGGEFGMGAEIGIATGKLHARGPVGAAQLCSFKYLVRGQGTVRP